MAKVLVVEDDLGISRTLQIGLSVEGFEIVLAQTIEAGWTLATSVVFDLIIMDINLPDGSGLDLVERIRGSGKRMPILFLSAKTDEETVVKGIHLGADDYIRKPFGIEELKARINKLLNRSHKTRNLIEHRGLKLDTDRRVAEFNGIEISLNRREFDILAILTNKADDVVTREFIITHLDQEPDAYDRIIDSHISHLRRKLRETIGEKLVIMPVYGVGYRLRFKGELE